MNTHCPDEREICKNALCGFPSNKNKQIMLCKKCRSAELAEDPSNTDLDINDYSAFEHTTSVAYNPDDNRFIFDKSFFEIVKMEDEQRAKFDALTS
mmetsp:Transcript_11618/g.14680  ORF Transcript_11618/g.14680 Transcript_11618/m.14680 type:complete len:96 (+) Transcript_11618:65-352(+)